MARCRSAGTKKCMMDCLRIFVSHLANTRLKRIFLVAVLTSVVLWQSLSTNIHKTGHYVQWKHQAVPRLPPSTKHFLHSRDDNMYVYSAIANYALPVSGSINIIITTLAASTPASLDCCALLENTTTLFVTQSKDYFAYHTINVAFIATIVEYFYPELYKAGQVSCVVPEIGQNVSHVTLTSSVCPSDINDYIPVHYPTQVPGGLAICAKIAHSGGLDPEKVIEWFELQRILGVDKVLMYDLGNPDSLNRVFRYYQETGMLDLLPYELPGEPANRTLLEKDKKTSQFHHDESMAVLECRQRMAGYSYVISHDMDEFIIPRSNVGLKQFFKEKMELYQDSAGFYFDAEFFISNWGPTNPEDDLAITRYRKATKPHWECTKFVFLPHRTLSITTHSIYPLPSYTTYRISQHEAVLHHYRRCPDDVWSTCFPETIVDHVMTRYHDLHSNVLKVRTATNTRPTWNPARARS